MPTFRGNRADLVRSLRLLPLVWSGRAPDSLGLARVFWGTVANEMFAALQDNYRDKLDGGSGVDGRPWAELSPATIERRLRAGRTDSKILIETEAMLRSLTGGAGSDPSGAEGQVNERIPGGVRIGSDVEYARFHQTGVPGRLPARPFLPDDSGDLPPAWQAVLDRCVETAMVRTVEALCAAGGID